MTSVVHQIVEQHTLTEWQVPPGAQYSELGTSRSPLGQTGAAVQQTLPPVPLPAKPLPAKPLPPLPEPPLLVPALLDPALPERPLLEPALPALEPPDASSSPSVKDCPPQAAISARGVKARNHRVDDMDQ
jgi:hypothetical protein